MWETVAGTFASPERHTGVSGNAACRCGAVGHQPWSSPRKIDSDRPRFGQLTVYAEVDSLLDLIKAMIA